MQLTLLATKLKVSITHVQRQQIILLYLRRQNIPAEVSIGTPRHQVGLGHVECVAGLRDEPLKVTPIGGEEAVPVPEHHVQRGAQLGPVQDPLRREVKLQRHVHRRR